ncbi:FAD-dependent monooxygenase [Amycolatopsis sp. cg9]|uniref:FAD-dependent monooxygenase n=1 Tax=Amycolatopsis sp. cg9 TaxID=3238801 RepID=UPI003524C7CD
MSDQARPRVLVTGGSIAGPALAWGLVREGFQPVVLERSPRRRSAGQNIDIRGLGREIVERMGIRDAVLGRLTGEAGTRFITETGHVYAEVARQEGRDGPTAELEILRGELAGILLGSIADDVEVRYGDFVVGADQDANGVDVRFDSGRRERFELLLVAEGRSSRTRRLLMPEQTTHRDKGLNVAFGTIDRRPEDDDWWYFMTTTQGRVVNARPDNVGTIRASVSFPARSAEFETLPAEAQIDHLRTRFRGAGWQTERILDGFAARPEEFYTDRWGQVVMSRWSEGRVGVLGDAAWGSGPTGMGTTLALVGAHVLAGELGRSLREPGGTHTGAFARYERLLRRYVDSAQGLAPGMPRLMHPMTSAGLVVTRALHRVVTSGVLRPVVEKAVITTQKHEPRLPEYPRLRASGTALTRAPGGV